MSKATSLISKVDRLLTRYNLTSREVYKRTITRTGGDALIGKPATISKVDVKLTPPPSVEFVSMRDGQMVVGNAMAMLGDYVCLCSPTAISKTDLSNPNVLLVMKAGSAEEECDIVGYNESVLEGQAVVYEILARSRKKT
jgi:hypothetical protein